MKQNDRVVNNVFLEHGKTEYFTFHEIRVLEIYLCIIILYLTMLVSNLLSSFSILSHHFLSTMPPRTRSNKNWSLALGLSA